MVIHKTARAKFYYPNQKPKNVVSFQFVFITLDLDKGKITKTEMLIFPFSLFNLF